MKKTITLLSMLLAIYGQAQTTVLSFESFTLSPSSYYDSPSSQSFTYGPAEFEHVQGFGFWLGGFSYTNVHDSTDGTFNNLYGNIAFRGRNNSEKFVVGQDYGRVALTVPNATVNGFYITNTTFAYKVILNGDNFSRAFGDTTGTGSGTTIPQGEYPDYFRLSVIGYRNGTLKSDSVHFYLADYRGSNDYIVNDWRYVNTSVLGAVDSIRFVMASTDKSDGWMNTPAFFALDDISISVPDINGLSRNQIAGLGIGPVPCRERLTISCPAPVDLVEVLDAQGRMILRSTQTDVDLGGIEQGIYIVRISSQGKTAEQRIVKQ